LSAASFASARSLASVSALTLASASAFRRSRSARAFF
jgi:hypothetical protein